MRQIYFKILYQFIIHLEEERIGEDKERYLNLFLLKIIYEHKKHIT